jgi:actin related protein 2/3 complex subunit 4
MSKELLLTPVVIARDANQQVLIEPSINSTRISIKIKQVDQLEAVLVDRFTRALALRAEEFMILRRKAVDGYSVSFLITHQHIETYKKDELVEFFVMFLKEIDAEIASMKLNVNARASVVANVYLTTFF